MKESAFYYLRVTLVLILLSAWLCSRKVALATDITADVLRILPYKLELELSRPFEYPFVAHYERAGKNLSFVAVEHWWKPNIKTRSASTHPTVQVIRHEYRAFQPKSVIFEGLSLANLSQDEIKKLADLCMARQYRNCGEAFFAINLAREKNAQFVTGEPKSKVLKMELLKLGYTPQDILGRFFLASLAETKLTKKMTCKNFPGWATEEMGALQKQYEITVRFNVGDFEAWYTSRVQNPKSYFDIRGEHITPDGGKGTTFLEKISSSIRMLRDQALLEKIKEQLDLNSRVMVVYGGSHFLTEKPALENMLGHATYIPFTPLRTKSKR